MDDYQKVLENEDKIKKLHHLIYQHSYIKQKEVIEKYSEKVKKEVEVWQRKVNYFEKKRKARRSVLALEQDRLHFYSQNIIQVKDQTTYLYSKAEKKISEKFIDKYQNEIKELGLKQKQTQDALQKLITQKEELGKKSEVEKDVFEKETKSYKEKYNKLMVEQNKDLQALKPKFYDYFSLLHKQQKFPAIVAVKDSYCGGCDMAFPPQIFQKVLTDTYAICSNCNRILVIDEAYFQDKK